MRVNNSINPVALRLGLIIEPIFDALERRTEIQEHIRLVRRLLNDLDHLRRVLEQDGNLLTDTLRDAIFSIMRFCHGFLIPAPSEAPPRPSSLSSMVPSSLQLQEIADAGEFETCRGLQMLRLMELTKLGEVEPTAEIGVTVWLRKFIGSACWTGSSLELRKARIVSNVVFCGLRSGFVSTEDASELIAKLVESLPAKAWSSSKGLIYGTSYLLRSLFSLYAGECNRRLSDYLNDICERILRRIEIRQSEAFQCHIDSIPQDKSHLLEELRFALAVLDAADAFSDLRYLNAALKVNDRLHSSVDKVEIPARSPVTPKNILKAIVILHYILSITRQEQCFRKLLEN